MRDSTSSGGWILAFDSGGRVAYRVAGTTFTTPLATADVRDGWHHVALTVAGGATAFYLDGALVHSGTGAGAAAGDALARDAQRHDQPVHARARRRGRGLRQRAAGGDDPRALRGRARRDRHGGARRARRADGDRAARTRRARLERRAGRRRLRRLPRHERRRAVHAGQPVAAERVRLHGHHGHRRHRLRLRGHRERRGQQPQPALGAGVRDAALDRRPPARLLAAPALRGPGDLLRRLGRGDDRQLRRRLAPELPGRAAPGSPPRTPRTRWRTSRSPSSAIPPTPTAARPPRPTTSTPRTPSTSRTPSGCAPPATATASTGAR